MSGFENKPPVHPALIERASEAAPLLGVEPQAGAADGLACFAKPALATPTMRCAIHALRRDNSLATASLDA